MPIYGLTEDSAHQIQKSIARRKTLVTILGYGLFLSTPILFFLIGFTAFSIAFLGGLVLTFKDFFTLRLEGILAVKLSIETNKIRLIGTSKDITIYRSDVKQIVDFGARGFRVDSVLPHIHIFVPSGIEQYLRVKQALFTWSHVRISHARYEIPASAAILAVILLTGALILADNDEPGPLIDIQTVYVLVLVFTFLCAAGAFYLLRDASVRDTTYTTGTSSALSRAIAFHVMLLALAAFMSFFFTPMIYPNVRYMFESVLHFNFQHRDYTLTLGINLFCYQIFFYGTMSLCFGFQRMGQYRLAQVFPRSTIRSAAIGMVEVQGTVAAAEQALTAPYTSMPCVFFDTATEEYRTGDNGTEWRSCSTKTQRVPFFLQDETGRVLVDPLLAEVRIPERKLGYLRNNLDCSAHPPAQPQLGDQRYVEYVLAPDDAVSIVGTLGIRKESSAEKAIQKGEQNALFIISDTGNQELYDDLKSRMSANLIRGSILFIGGLLGILVQAKIL
jgi:hypothetical protein